MIKLRTEVPKNNSAAATFLKCNICGKNLIFFSTFPKSCYGCNSKFPDIRSIKLDEKYRIEWHRKITYDQDSKK